MSPPARCGSPITRFTVVIISKIWSTARVNWFSTVNRMYSIFGCFSNVDIMWVFSTLFWKWFMIFDSSWPKNRFQIQFTSSLSLQVGTKIDLKTSNPGRRNKETNDEQVKPLLWGFLREQPSWTWGFYVVSILNVLNNCPSVIYEFSENIVSNNHRWFKLIRLRYVSTGIINLWYNDLQHRSDGRKYIGQWFENQMHGFGQLYDSEISCVYAGRFEYDVKTDVVNKGAEEIVA